MLGACHRPASLTLELPAIGFNMNQAQFLAAYDDYSILPRHLRRELLWWFKKLVAQKLLVNEPVILPQLGKIYIQFQPARARHNIRLDTTTVYPAKYKIKMSRFGYQQQRLYDKYNINVEYLGYKDYPSQSIADELAEASQYDLLTCKDFMRNLVEIIIAAAELDEKVMLYGLGSFKPNQLIIKRPDPVSPIGLYTCVTVSDNGEMWCAIPTIGASLTPLFSPDGITWNAESAINNWYYSAVAWSEFQVSFTAVGETVIDGLPYFVSMWSTDGKNWTEIVESFYFSPLSVWYAAPIDKWLAGGYDFSSGSMLESSDGINWAYVTGAVLTAVTGFAYSSTLELYVAVGFSDGTADKAYSSDGVNWTVSTDHLAANYYGVAWSESLECFVATADKAGVGYWSKSTDGINWTDTNIGTIAVINPPCAGSGKVKFVFTTYKNSRTYIWNSNDGISFMQRQEILNFTPLAITYNALLNRWAITSLAEADNAILMSNNGTVFYESRESTDPPPEPETRTVITYLPSKKLEESIN